MSKIKIVYDPSKVAESKPRKQANICNTFEPGNGYTDTEAYEGTRFDANVYGMDAAVERANHMAQTHIPMSVPMAQLNMAVMANKQPDGTHVYEFEVTDYKEEVYYKQIGDQLKDQGFTISVSSSNSSSPANSGSDATQ